MRGLARKSDSSDTEGVAEGSTSTADEWMTVGQLAEQCGVEPVRLERLMVQMGLREVSRVHCRGDGSAREYSPAIAGLVERELKSRGGSKR